MWPDSKAASRLGQGQLNARKIQCKITLTSFEDYIQIQSQSDPKELNDCKIQAKTVFPNLQPDSVSYNTKPTSLDVSGELTQMRPDLAPGKMGWNWEGQGSISALHPHSIRTPSALRNWSSATQGAHIVIKYTAGKESLPTTGWQKQISAGRLDKALVVGSAGLCGLGSRQMTP